VGIVVSNADKVEGVNMDEYLYLMVGCCPSTVRVHEYVTSRQRQSSKPNEPKREKP
jgi:hypothetical protein